MNRPCCYGALAVLLTSACATEKTVGGGNPRTLAPLLGGARVVAAPHTRKPPSEPVEDYVADLGQLRHAWPAVQAQLPRLLRSLIARGSWTDAHHAVHAASGVLRLRHRPAVVAEARKLVEELKARLLRPVHIQVAFIEVNADAAPRIVTRGLAPRFRSAAFRNAVAQGKARDLARASFSTHSGRWTRSERLTRHPQLSGVLLSNGGIFPRTTTLASGATMQAAAWLRDDRRAVVALAGSYTGPAKGGLTVRQQVHRQLPRQKTTEWRWQGHQSELSLPVRDMMEYSGKLTVSRGQWTVAAAMPRDDGRVVAVVVRVDWTPSPKQPVTVKPLAKEKSFVLRLIPVALPNETVDLRTRRVQMTSGIVNRQAMDEQAKQFTKRARSRQQVQKKNTYNFQSMSGALALSAVQKARPVVRVKTFFTKTESFKFRPQRPLRRPSMRSVLGAMPARLEKLKAEVMQERWPEGTALEFSANTVFVVHRPEVADKVSELLSQTHAWRNQRVQLAVGFPRLSVGMATKLRAGRVDAPTAKAIARGKAMLGPAAFSLRGGSHSELFVAEMHSVFSTAWVPNRSSPPMHVYWKGAQLSALAELGPVVGRGVNLYFKRYALSRTAPQTVAGAILQRPIDASWEYKGAVQVDDRPMLIGLLGTGKLSTGLLVSRKTLP